MAFTAVATNAPSFTPPSARTTSPTWMSPSVMGSRRLRKVVFSSATNECDALSTEPISVTFTPSMAVTLPMIQVLP